MLSEFFLGISLLGAEWVLWLLLFLSVVSVSLIVERVLFYRAALKGMQEFREKIRQAILSEDWNQVARFAQNRVSEHTTIPSDFEAELASTILNHCKVRGTNEDQDPEVLSEIGNDVISRGRIKWEKNLSFLATIGNNAPFVGLFGTVIGIIQAFQDIASQSGLGSGATQISSGLADALIATAVGILVAIPAVAAFNFFQRKVKTAVSEAEALKSLLVGKLAKHTIVLEN